MRKVKLNIKKTNRKNKSKNRVPRVVISTKNLNVCRLKKIKVKIEYLV